MSARTPPSLLPPLPSPLQWVFRQLYALDTPAGDTAALSEMRRRWGWQMVSGSDGGTVWESFADSESCHNYGAAVVSFLSGRVLGVQLGGRGNGGTLTVEPRLGDLDHVGGIVVTELGPVNVTWARPGNGTLAFTLALPPGAATTALRLADCAGTLTLNGAPTPTRQDGRYAVVDALPPGDYVGSIATTAGGVAA